MKIAIGDSFTYGEELEDRTASAWPALLGYDNHGLRGASNEYIFRTSLELAPHCTHMIVAWSECTRYDLYAHDPVSIAERYSNYTGPIQVNPGWSRIAWFKELYTRYTDQEYQFRKTVAYMIALQSVLQAHEVDWYYCSAFSNQELFETYRDLELIERIDQKRFIGFPNEGFVEWAYGSPQGPNGHPLELGHKRIAEEIARYI